jgi:hypothetical protein
LKDKIDIIVYTLKNKQAVAKFNIVCTNHPSIERQFSSHLKAKTLVKREYNLKAAGVRVGAGAYQCPEASW